MEQEEQAKGAHPTPEHDMCGVARFLIPRRGRARAGLRLALAIAFNALLAISISWHPADPYHSPASAAWIAIFQIATAMAALVALLPVVLFGREIPRLLAIGLSVLPAYVLALGIMEVVQILRNA